MKNLILLLLFLTTISFAANWGLFEQNRSDINLNLNGTLTGVLVIWDQGASTGVGRYMDANIGALLGAGNTFEISAWNIRTYKSGGDVTGAVLYYRIYEVGLPSGAFTAVVGAWLEDISLSDQRWGKNTSTTIPTGTLVAGKNYVFEIYISASGTGDPNGTIPDNNGGNNYQSTFTTDAAFPVELSSFSSAINGSTVELNWATATEVNNYGFDVERSADNITFNKIGFVAGAGNSNVQKQYSYSDANLARGKYYYRLKQVDTDGKYEYSQVVQSEIAGTLNKFTLSQNYPNPFNPNTVIAFALPKDSNVKLSVYNMLGEEVAVLVNGVMSAGNHSVDFSATNLNSGMYVYRLEAGEFSSVRKMTLLK